MRTGITVRFDKEVLDDIKARARRAGRSACREIEQMVLGSLCRRLLEERVSALTPRSVSEFPLPLEGEAPRDYLTRLSDAGQLHDEAKAAAETIGDLFGPPTSKQLDSLPDIDISDHPLGEYLRSTREDHSEQLDALAVRPGIDPDLPAEEKRALIKAAGAIADAVDRPPVSGPIAAEPAT